MEHLDSFEEFLKKKQEAEKGQEVDWESRKNEWIQSISNLYSNIREWLNPFIDKGLISLNDSNFVNISEEYIGKYDAPRMDIFIGNDIIRLNPRGTLIIGSYGRIDMHGPKGEIMLIQPKWNEWKFAIRTPKIKTWDITDESFMNTIKELV